MVRAAQKTQSLPRRARLRGPKLKKARAFWAELEQFEEFGSPSAKHSALFPLTDDSTREIPVLVNEFWTSKQRVANSLHEISYRACFKPLLPKFFIERLSRPGAVVYDPFMGRGTTVLEALLNKRRGVGCDVNPVSKALMAGRFAPPNLRELKSRVDSLDLAWNQQFTSFEEELLTFYHPETLRQILALRHYLTTRKEEDNLDHIDLWLQTVALNRLTGHSTGFFSVYTLPPNQATSVKAQKKINERRKQRPPVRDVKKIILKKSKSLLRDCTPPLRRQLKYYSRDTRIVISDCSDVPQIQDESVDLVITSPPFLDVVNYSQDNWLRAWFIGVDIDSLDISMIRNPIQWREKMTSVLTECHRVQKPGSFIVFEVGEVKRGNIDLELESARCLHQAGYHVHGIVVNQQEFTKTSNCWGITNNKRGTNSNRMVIGQKPRQS